MLPVIEPQGKKGEEVPHIQDRSLSKFKVSLIATKYGQKIIIIHNK